MGSLIHPSFRKVEHPRCPLRCIDHCRYRGQAARHSSVNHKAAFPITSIDVPVEKIQSPVTSLACVDFSDTTSTSPGRLYPPNYLWLLLRILLEADLRPSQLAMRHPHSQPAALRPQRRLSNCPGWPSMTSNMGRLLRSALYLPPLQH
jgi:hypothetical protein